MGSLTEAGKVKIIYFSRVPVNRPDSINEDHLAVAFDIFHYLKSAAAGNFKPHKGADFHFSQVADEPGTYTIIRKDVITHPEDQDFFCFLHREFKESGKCYSIY